LSPEIRNSGRWERSYPWCGCDVRLELQEGELLQASGLAIEGDGGFAAEVAVNLPQETISEVDSGDSVGTKGGPGRICVLKQELARPEDLLQDFPNHVP